MGRPACIIPQKLQSQVLICVHQLGNMWLSNTQPGYMYEVNLNRINSTVHELMDTYDSPQSAMVKFKQTFALYSGIYRVNEIIQECSTCIS